VKSTSPHSDGKFIVTEPSSIDSSEKAHPERIGPYLIQQELGSGGMGTVYLGEHVDTHELAAVKILPASMSREPGFVARFGREIAAMQQLKSDNIVQLIESGEDDGLYYYAMEYVRGETLTSRLKREKRLPWREVIDLGVQMCKALKAAHNTGIVHRDLKPSNLLIDEADQVKLTDFGIAQVFASSKLTITGGILGTAEYMSPEQAQGRRANRQSDIYSLGAVLYVMLTGRPPFTGKNTMEILQKHRFSQFDSPRRIVPDIPHWLDEVVCKCLSKKPEDRYPDAYVVMLRLQEIPRKVDMREAESEEVAPLNSDDETISSTGSSHQPHLGGTIVRDLFRAEVDSQNQRSFVGSLFDNVWVLSILLVAILLGAFLMVRWNRPSPDQMFARGVELMSQPEGNSWEVARTQYFEPLLEKDAETWGPKIEPYQAALQVFELKRQFLGRGRQKEPIPHSEPEAILRQAIELRKLGRIGEAKSKLIALQTLVAGDGQWKVFAEIADKFLEELKSVESSARLDFVQQALNKADELQAQGENSAAKAIWRSVQELYDADPDADILVKQARSRLSNSSSASDAPSVTEGEALSSPSAQ